MSQNNDLISRSALLKNKTRMTEYDESGCGVHVFVVKEEDVLDAPAVDAEVVRCKDCVKRDQSFRCIALYYGFNPHDDWFCAEGERDNAEVEG